jgi:branched-chain amino acid transport system substrate-binding protein
MSSGRERPARRRVGTAAAALLVLVGMVVAAACGSSAESTSRASTTTSAGAATTSAAGLSGSYRVGYIATDSGPAAGFGVNVSRGVEFAVDEINDTGVLGEGVTLELVREDTGGDPARGIAAVNRLADADVVGVICCQPSPEALSIRPVLVERGIPAVVTVARAPGLPEAPHVFRTVARGEGAYASVLEQVRSSTGATTIVAGVNGDNDGVKNDLAVWQEAVGSVGLDMRDTIDVNTGDTDFSGPATQVVHLAPDIYLNSMLPAEGALMIKALRDRGFTGVIVSNEAIASEHNFEIAGAALDGVVFPVAYAPGSPVPAAERFTAAYEQATGRKPDLFVAQGYTAAWFLAHGLRAAGVGDREAVGRALAGIAEMETVYGTIQFVEGEAKLTGEPLIMAWTAEGSLVVWTP